MGDQMTKESLLPTMRSAREEWEALLSEVGADRMTLPGVEGDWSVKDIVAHVTYYERWLVGYLQSARRNEAPNPTPETAGFSMDQRNAWIYDRIRNQSLQEVIADASEVFSQLLGAVEVLSEQELTDPKLFPWTEGEPLWHAIPGDSYDHYQDHEDNFRAWLDARVIA